MEFLAHVVLIAFAVFIGVSAVPGSSLFSWHPTCMSIAVFLLTEATIFFHKPNKGIKVYVHWALAAAGLGSAIYGFLCVYNNKENDKKPHFQTYHGLAGIATLGLLVIQAVGGNLANLTNFFPNIIPGVKPTLLKWGHRLSGALSLTAVYTTLLLALCSFWFTAIVTSSLIWWGILLMILYPYLYAVFNVKYSKPKFKQ